MVTSQMIFEGHNSDRKCLISLLTIQKAIWFMSTHIIEDNAVTSSIRIAEVFPELVGKKTRAIWKGYGGMLKYIIN